MVQGVVSEHMFFKYFESTADLIVFTNGHKEIETFQCISNTEYHSHSIRLTKFTKGVLYELRFDH